MLKLKNKYSEMYRAEMEKFRVENPFLQGLSDEDVFTSMFVGDETMTIKISNCNISIDMLLPM